jgi:hypothetical protein
MISDLDLRSWTDSLDLDITVFEGDMIHGLKKRPHEVLGPAALAFLRRPNPELNKRVEAAVEAYATTDEWPASLPYDEYLHLFYRAFNAHGMLIAAAAMEKGAPELVKVSGPSLPSPDPGDKPRFIRWLYIDLWNAGEKGFIERISQQIADTRRA